MATAAQIKARNRFKNVSKATRRKWAARAAATRAKNKRLAPVAPVVPSYDAPFAMRNPEEDIEFDPSEFEDPLPHPSLSARHVSLCRDYIDADGNRQDYPDEETIRGAVENPYSADELRRAIRFYRKSPKNKQARGMIRESIRELRALRRNPELLTVTSPNPGGAMTLPAMENPRRRRRKHRAKRRNPRRGRRSRIRISIRRNPGKKVIRYKGRRVGWMTLVKSKGVLGAKKIWRGAKKLIAR